jgi:hypothetical protein
MEQEKVGINSFNIIENLYQPIKDQEKLFGDRRYNFFKENNVDPAELIGITRDPNAAVVQLNKDDPKNKEVNPLYAKDIYNFIADLPDQALYRLVLGGMNGARLGVNLLPAFSRLIGAEPGEDRFDDIYKFSQKADENIKNKITMFKDIYANAFKEIKGRDPNKASDLVSYIAQDYPYYAPIYSTLDKIGLPKTISIPLSVGLSSGVAFDPKEQTADGTSESSFFFDSASIKSLKEFFGALPNTPEGEIFDRAYQAFETTGVAAAIRPIINTALFLKRNVPAFNKAIPGASVATAGATTIGEVTDQTILNPQDETIQNQEPTILDNVKSGIDQFGNKLSEIGGAIKKEFSGEAMANPLVKTGVTKVPVFKSAVVDAIEKIPNKAPVEQISGIIKNTPGVTQQELKWIGLDDFLKTKSNQKFIEKQELADFIQANRIDVNETKLGGKVNLSQDFKLRIKEFEKEYRNATRNTDDFIGYDTYNIKYQDIDTFQDVKQIDLGSRKIGVNFYRTLDFYKINAIMDRIVKAEKFRTETSSIYANDVFEPLYLTSASKLEPSFINKYKETLADGSESFVLHRLDDKLRMVVVYTDTKTSEMLLTSPRYRRDRIIYFDPIEVKKYAIEKEFRDEARKAGTTRFDRFTEPGGTDYTEIVLTVNQQGKSNLPVEFETSVGTNVLGAYKTTMTYASPKPHFGTINEIAHVRFKTRDVKGQKILSVEELQSDLVNQTQAGQMVFQDGYRVKGVDYNDLQKDTLKDFPFKNNWHELVTRRLVRYAADNGFDAIAFQKGIVSLRRYGMTDSISGIIVTRAKNRSASAINEYDSVQVGMNKEDAEIYESIDGLKKYVSEEFANEIDKYIKTGTIPDSKLFRTETTSFPDMDVVTFRPEERIEIIPKDNQGRIEFYDKVIPSYLKKYAKKWNAPVYQDVIDISQAVAEQGLRKKEIPVVVLKLTPEMKRSVQEKSQPLFNIVLPALTAGSAAKVISDNMENNTISNPTKN